VVYLDASCKKSLHVVSLECNACVGAINLANHVVWYEKGSAKLMMTVKSDGENRYLDVYDLNGRVSSEGCEIVVNVGSERKDRLQSKPLEKSEVLISINSATGLR
jgi:hypothetical protein